MAVWDLWSKRKQKQPDVYQYDDLPKAFRVQVIHIWVDAIGEWNDHSPSNPMNHWWIHIHNGVSREKGVFRLAQASNPFVNCQHYLLDSATDDALDLIEASFRFVDGGIRQIEDFKLRAWSLIRPDEAIDELNHRFREHGIGYEFSAGEIIRVDSKYLHAETVKPALQLLHDGGKGFAGPLDEFQRAHEHHRKGDQKEAISHALKAFESTMKAICTERGWAYDPDKDTARQLIDVLFQNELIPAYLQNEFGGLRAILETGVPTTRNRTSGHGQGPTPTTVPDYLASYVLHTTAANIVLLVEAHRAKK